MKTSGIAFTTLLAVLAIGIVPSLAQAQNINKRLDRQNHRITQGVVHGRLTPGQAARLRSNDERIHAQEERDRSMHNGHLTHREKKQLNRELNRNSKAIRRAKSRL